MQFRDIYGQEAIKHHFRTAIKRKRLSHAYIISGERYSGKMTIAEAFAATLQCEKQGEDACGNCKSCKQASHHNQPDIIYISREDKNTIQVEKIRQQINETVAIRPYSSRYKIYIIKDADKMNENAQNVLLKTLEEPPEYAVFLLLVQSAEMLLPTIRSRCVQLFMAPIDTSTVSSFISQQVSASDQYINEISAISMGSIGRALQIMEDDNFKEMLQNVCSIVWGLGITGKLSVEEAVRIAVSYKTDLDKFTELLELIIRDVLLYKTIGKSDSCIFQTETENIQKMSERSTFDGLNQTILKIYKLREERLSNVNVEVLLQLVMISIKEGSDT